MDAQTKRDLALGREHYAAGEYAEAEAPLRRVLDKHDGFADVHNMLGVIAYQSGDPETAATAFGHALKLNPAYNEAALNYSVVLNELGRYDEAREAYAGVKAERAAQPSGADELDGFIRGKIANLHAKVAEAYVACGIYAPAIEELRTALDLCPNFADLRVKLAVALRDAGLREEALEELEGVRDDKPKYVDGRVQLGLTYWSLDRKPDARGEWETVLELDPKNRSVKAYLSMAKD